MARLRKFCAYRRLERPYTRRSKFSEKNYIKANPHLKIVRFEMGPKTQKFDYTLKLISKSDLQIRHDSLESARQTCNRFLEKNLGKNEFYFKVIKYPHHVLRENPLAAGAGADRMSTGMAHSFGKAIGLAAQVREGEPIFELRVNKANLEIGKKTMKRASYKIPCPCRIEVIENKR
ncbi:MAG: 50S ribosomal protein L16 [Candidatus Woesearchaeota archaeon]|nr:50S ribosomal protein L16 [Candidatus Woesearchaeota archaeon]